MIKTATQFFRYLYWLSIGCFALFAISIACLLVLADMFPDIEEGREAAWMPVLDMAFWIRNDDPPGCYAQGFIFRTVICHRIPDADRKNQLLSLPLLFVTKPFEMSWDGLEPDAWPESRLLGIFSWAYILLTFIVFPFGTLYLGIMWLFRRVRASLSSKELLRRKFLEAARIREAELSEKSESGDSSPHTAVNTAERSGRESWPEQDREI